MQGRLIKKIDAKGKGPKEYLGLLKLRIHDDELWLRDRMAKQFLVYTLEGEFLRKEPCPIHIIDFQVIDSSFLFYSIPTANGVTQLNNCPVFAGNIDTVYACGFENKPLQNSPFDFNFFMSSSRNNILLRPQWSDSVYQFTTDTTCFVKYVIEDSKSVWKLRDESINVMEITDDALAGNVTYCTSFVEADDYVFVGMTGKGGIGNAYVYDIPTGKVFKLEDETRVTTYRAQAVIGNKFVTSIDPGWIEFLYEKHNSGEQVIRNPEFLEVINNYEDYQNPVLIFYEFNLPK